MEIADGYHCIVKTEIEKITEEIEEIEHRERALLAEKIKKVSFFVTLANVLALLFFVCWLATAQDMTNVNKELLLIFSLTPLVVIFYLFMLYRCYDFKQEKVQGYFRNNFYTLFFLFTALSVVSIII